MGLSDPKGIYGVHSVTPYRRTDGTPYGTLKVVKSSTLSVEGSTQELMGGSSKYPWAVEDAESKVEMSLKFSQYEDFLFELFLGKAVTANAAEPNGAVGTLTAVKGALVNATTGIASVALKSASKADLKFEKYVVVAVGTSTVDVYAVTDIDFGRGTALNFATDGLKINAAPLTVPGTGGNIEIPGTGVQLNGGSGTVALTVGDTATFWTRPVNNGSRNVRVGGAAFQTMPEFGCIILAQKRGNGEMTELDCFRCKGSGLPIGFEANAWASVEVKVKAFYDSIKDGVFDFRSVSF